MFIYGKNLQNILLENRIVDDIETWHSSSTSFAEIVIRG